MGDTDTLGRSYTVAYPDPDAANATPDAVACAYALGHSGPYARQLRHFYGGLRE